MRTANLEFRTLSELLAHRLRSNRFWSSTNDIPRQLLIRHSSLKCARCALDNDLQHRSLRMFAFCVSKSKRALTKSITLKTASCPSLVTHYECYHTKPMSQLEYRKIVIFDQKSLIISARLFSFGLSKLSAKLNALSIVSQRNKRQNGQLNVDPVSDSAADRPQQSSSDEPIELSFSLKEAFEAQSDFNPPIATNSINQSSVELNFKQLKLNESNEIVHTQLNVTA
jgi:hypothetical protein